MGSSAKVGGQGAQSLESIMGLIPGLQRFMPGPQGIFGTGGQGFGTVLGPNGQPQQSMWDPMQQMGQMDLAPLLQMMQPPQQAPQSTRRDLMNYGPIGQGLSNAIYGGGPSVSRHDR